MDIIARVRPKDDLSSSVSLYRPDTSQQCTLPPTDLRGIRLSADGLEAIVEANSELLENAGFFAASSSSASSSKGTLAHKSVSAPLLLSLGDSSGFSCSACGECCRAPQSRGALSPLDVFKMTRASSLQVLGVGSTDRLFQSKDFAGAFLHSNYGPDSPTHGYPTLHLRANRKGECFFAHPVLLKGGRVLSWDDQRALQQDGITYDRSPSTARQLDTREFYLTEEEEIEAARRVVEHDEEGGEDTDSEPDTEEPAPIEIINGMGRRALNCLLGPANMPLGCATFPYSFVHGEAVTRRVDVEGCEGFLGEDKETTTPLAFVGHNLEYLEGEAALATRRSAGDRTVAEVLGDESIQGAHDAAWFKGLVEALSSFLPSSSFFGKAEILRAYSSNLARIFFDFDSLKSAVSRPIKSQKRLKRTISDLAWSLARTTRIFLESSSSEDLKHYNALLDRLAL